MAREKPDFDFGSGVTGRWVGWHPERKLNPQYGEPGDEHYIPDIDHLGIILTHPHDGETHTGCINLRTPEAEKLSAYQVSRGYKPMVMWEVESWDPLTISPSVHQVDCGWHGYIREGKWIPC